jgi:tetratricopeptide (TPR) repeat protein
MTSPTEQRRATIALAYAAALITAGRHDQAAAVLEDAVITEDAQAAQWYQFIKACLFTRPAAGPDLRAVAVVCPPAHASYVLDEVSAAVASMSAAAAASLGQFAAALELSEKLSTKNPYVAADTAWTRGWCQWELGDEDAARASFAAAAVDGALLDAALAAEQADGLAQAQTRLDELIGLEGPKELIAVWRTEIQIDQLLAAQGEETSATNENHIVLEGPPGTAKTSFARIVAEILFALGKIFSDPTSWRSPRRTSSSATSPRPPSA